jgi:hypothetical protein
MCARVANVLWLVHCLTQRSRVQIPQRWNKFVLHSPHWLNLGCHMAPCDWAMCHLWIFPYNLVSMHNHLPRHFRTAMHCTLILPHHHPYNQVTYPVRYHLNIHTAQSPYHVDIHTSTCHLYCHVLTYHWAMSASV